MVKDRGAHSVANMAAQRPTTEGTSRNNMHLSSHEFSIDAKIASQGFDMQQAFNQARGYNIPPRPNKSQDGTRLVLQMRKLQRGGRHGSTTNT